MWNRFALGSTIRGPYSISARVVVLCTDWGMCVGGVRPSSGEEWGILMVGESEYE